MKILVDSYSECFQNEAGGVQLKIKYYTEYMSKINEVELYNKWTDKITDYDILHIFKPGFQHYSLVRFAKNHNVPVVVSATAATENKYKILLKKTIDCLLPVNTPYHMLKQMYRWVSAVTVQTVYEKDFVCRTYGIPYEQVHIVPNGISVQPSAELKGLFRNKYDLQDDFVLQVGRFDRNKNQLSTIKALAGTGIKLVLIGGPDKDDMDYYHQCTEEAGDNVKFIGWIDHDDPLLTSAYMDCQAMILPSHQEIFGNALLEAAACGANIVSTNVLPLKSWGIQDLCLSVDPDRIDDIREKLITAYQKPKSSILREKIVNMFTWEGVVAQYNDVYREILGDK